MKKIIKTVLREHFKDNPRLSTLDKVEWYVDNIATEIITEIRTKGWFLDLSEEKLKRKGVIK